MRRFVWLLLGAVLIGATPISAAPAVVTGSATFVDATDVTLCPELPVASAPTEAGTQDEVRREPGTYPVRADASVKITLNGAPKGLLQIRVADDAGSLVGRQPPLLVVKPGQTVTVSANLPKMDVTAEGSLATTITTVSVQLLDKTGKTKLGQPSSKTFTQPGGGC